jgi:hypothetical protein
MIAFEIRINGELCGIGQDVTAVTLVADWVQRRRAERVSLHVGHPEGHGPSNERTVHWLDAHLGVGDEVVIRIVDVAESASPGLETCSFCAGDLSGAASLIHGRQVAICSSCIALFDASLAAGMPLPLGAQFQDDPKQGCGFCGKAPGEVPGVVVRNGAALCPECLRSCAEIIGIRSGG